MSGDETWEDSKPEKEVHVSWVYLKRREELVRLSKELGLSATGTVPEIRARVIAFLRTGRIASPFEEDPEEPEDPDETNEPEETVIKEIMEDTAPLLPTAAQMCDSIRKWNLKFDGNTDPVSFLERIEELTSCYKYEPDSLLTVLPELLKGKVLLWYRNNKQSWTSWEEFEDSFRSTYLPPRFRFRMEDEIRKRTQGYQEKATEYITAIQTLLRRHGGYPPLEQLERIYENLRPEYKLYIRRRDFTTLTDLLQITEEFEVTQMLNKSFAAPPTPSQSFIPETAFAGKPHNLPPKQNIQPPARNINPFVNTVTTPIRRNPAENPAGNNFPTRNSLKNSNYNREKVCWRCGIAGHWRINCKRPAKLFCSHCVKTGVFSRDCHCQQQGNGERRKEREDAL